MVVALLSQLDDQTLGVALFAVTPGALGLVLTGQFLFFLTAIPGQQGFGQCDGHDLSQAMLDAHSVFGQDPVVSLSQRDTAAQLVPKILFSCLRSSFSRAKSRLKSWSILAMRGFLVDLAKPDFMTTNLGRANPAVRFGAQVGAES